MRNGLLWGWDFGFGEYGDICIYSDLIVLYSFLGVKIIIGVNLVSYAIGRRAGMEARRAEDEAINNFERDPIGEGKEEQVCDLSLYMSPGRV